jgi:hypothetical protein
MQFTKNLKNNLSMGKITTVRFYWSPLQGDEILVECEYTQYSAGNSEWVISRIEPDYQPPENEIKNIVACAPQTLDIQYIGRYFSDEAEKARRDLEIAETSWEMCRENYNRAKIAHKNAEARLNSIRSEIMQKFQQ